MASPLLFLLMDTLLFLGLAAACFVLGLWRAKGEDPNEAATSSTGTEMRRRLQLLLLLANVARAVGLAVEIVLFEDGACPSSWTCALVRGGPDLVFLTAYSMLILFWAQVRLEWPSRRGSAPLRHHQPKPSIAITHTHTAEPHRDRLALSITPPRLPREQWPALPGLPSHRRPLRQQRHRARAVYAGDLPSPGHLVRTGG